MRFWKTMRRTLTALSLTLLASGSLLVGGCDNNAESSANVDQQTQTAEQKTPEVTPVADEQAPAPVKPAEVAPKAPETPIGPDFADGPRIVFDQTFHDFGVISDTLPVSFDFVFRNGGNEVLKISNVKAACGCTAAAPTKSEYLPGEEGSIHVTFDPKNRTGHQAKSIRVTTNDVENKITILKISCDILASVNVEPKVFRFNEVEAGHAKSVTGSVRLRGDGYEVTEVEVNGPYADAKIVGSETIEVSGMPATSTTIEVTVHADAPLGWLDRRVIIRTSNPEKPIVEAPLWANVLGPIEIQPAKLPLGVVRSGVPFRRELRLVSRDGELFKLNDWKIDSETEGLDMNIAVAGDVPDEGVAILRLIVTGTGPEQIGKLEGTIVLSASLDPDRDINVPFHCVVRPPAK